MHKELLNVLVLGSGGRENALHEVIDASLRTDTVLIAPGNPGTWWHQRRNIDIGNHAAVIELCKAEKIDLIVCGPEAPLVAGMYDDLTDAGIRCVGPSKLGAQLEASKIFAKTRCKRWNIPTADFDFAGSYTTAKEILNRTGFKVIKADGLCGGKGVIVADNAAEACETARQFLVEGTQGKAGSRVVIEERLEGREASFIALCDGKNAFLLPIARDYKRVGDEDTGPNTGGMGALSPVPDIDDELIERVKREILFPTLAGMAAAGMPYHGFLYLGVMITADGPKLIEYNCRGGDPEMQVILMRLFSDLVEYLYVSTTFDGLSQLPPFEMSHQTAVCIVLASGGYPANYKIGKLITGINKTHEYVAVYHAGTKEEEDKLLTNGGRVLNVVAMADTVEEARAEAYLAAEQIKFEGKYYRKDIAA